MKTVYKIYLPIGYILDEKNIYSPCNALLYCISQNEKYFVYAIATSKKDIDEFKGTRNNDIFFIVEDVIENSIYNDIIESKLVLHHYNYITKGHDNDVTMITVLTTELEYDYARKQFELIKQNMFYGRVISRMPFIRQLNREYIHALRTIMIYDIFEYLFDGTIDRPELIADEYKILLSQNKELFIADRGDNND